MYQLIKIDGSPFHNGAAINLSITTPTIAIQIDGTFTSGTYSAQVSQDGNQWHSIPLLTGLNVPAATIGATGVYRFDTNGYRAFRLQPAAVVGSLSIWAFGSSVPLGFIIT
jgi:hypothetical protein